MRKITPLSGARGFILPIFLITTVLIAIILVTIMSTATLDYRLSSREVYKVNAQLTADAGLDKALVELISDADWTGTANEVELLNDGKTRTTYETIVTEGSSSNRKVVSVTARTYSPITATEPQITRRYEIDVEAVTSGTMGPSSVVSGVGGLILSNNAKISGGDVVVNGKITLGNNSQIGLSINPVNVRVAHQSCPNPPDATYPSVCASGENGQPISMGSNARIYGNVQATNQTQGNNMYDPGLVAGATFAPVPLPTYDRDGHKAAVAVTRTPGQLPCGSNGSQTWPANVKITGNITLGNNCRVTLEGNAWVTGDVTMGNNARFIVSDTVGTTRPVVMVDGSAGFRFGNNARIDPNSSDTGVQIITYWSDASCSPDCTTVTGADLLSSQNTLTIDLSNNGSAQYSVLWAAWSKVRVANNGAIGAVTGQTVELGNNAVISFSASVPGSDNLITTWVKRGYMRAYN